MPIQRLLVANRGEIALRVFRTCRALGVETVAVAAPDDAAALHARSADATVEISNYLHSEEHIRAAREAGADSIHPGYGFLAENADFAEAVEAAGLTWIGPPPAALRLGGNKIAAKRIARDAGVPVLPDGEPEDVGFPLLVKAAAGGGGRGMRVVPLGRGRLDEALAAAQREAAGAFADGTLYFERYLERPRHVEVQLLADAHASVVALGERDCSIQRRHQKVLEEAPAPHVDAGLRARLHEAAVAFGRAIGYRSAGTVEFVVEGNAFFFLELNGRIQVEHPVTEAVTGLDLVERQILDRRRGDPRRVPKLRMATPSRCACTPRIRGRFCLRPAASSAFGCRGDVVRVDSGVEEGDEIGLGYDPMIAKLVTHGPTRVRGARSPRARARRNGGRGDHDEPPVPPLARRPSGGPGRRCDHGVLDRLPPAHGTTSPPPRGAVPRALAPGVSGAAPAPPPDLDVESHRPRSRGRA